MKKWQILSSYDTASVGTDISPAKGRNNDIISVLLENRGIRSETEINGFLHPPLPDSVSAADVLINPDALSVALDRLKKAIDSGESIAVYADYDADGITAGAVMWEALNDLGARVMPYIPHRIEEGYGLSEKGIDNVKAAHNPSLIITVDHGITGHDKVKYAAGYGIDVIVTDHHVKPQVLPDCPIVHTTQISGAGVSWFVAKELYRIYRKSNPASADHLAIAAIGTIADMVPLTGINRIIAKYGLEGLRSTRRVGLLALMEESGLTQKNIGTYDVSHMLAPRLNAMGRLVHAMDALRLLCTKDGGKAADLAGLLGTTNRERQQLTIDASQHALEIVRNAAGSFKKILFVSDTSYNQGVIGLVAGRLAEEYYRPAVVIAEGREISKASARSISGFNLVEAIRTCSDILIDVGGHPMAAGFTVETKYLPELKIRLENLADQQLDESSLIRELRVDMSIPLNFATEELWNQIRNLEPFGFGNPEPVFVSRGTVVLDTRTVGTDRKHLKLTIAQPGGANRSGYDCIAFGMGKLAPDIKPGQIIDLAYAIDINIWNGNRKLQLKIKDIQIR